MQGKCMAYDWIWNEFCLTTGATERKLTAGGSRARPEGGGISKENGPSDQA